MIVFETTSAEICYMALDSILCIIRNHIYTKANAWGIDCADKDLDRVKTAWDLYLRDKESNS